MDSLLIKDMINMIDIMTSTIIENEVPFCELDSAAGDGDFGSSLAKGFRMVRLECNSLNQEDFGLFLKDCSMIITEHCGGASGPIWGSAFRSASKVAMGKTEFSIGDMAELLQSAIDGIQKRGGAKLGDKTLLDALIPAVESLKQSSTDHENFFDAMSKCAQAAVKGAERTKEIIAKKGRASYLGERSLQYPDAGATAIGVIFTTIVDKLFVTAS